MSKLKLLLQTIGKVLEGAVKDHTVLAKDEEVKRRLTICGKCTELEDNLACKKCGCRVAYKARLIKANCPIGKW